MINHIEPECKGCTGTKNCTKYCNIKVGENIVNFVNGIDTETTNIGEYREDHRGKPSLIISGFQIEKEGSPIDILTPIADVAISSSGKLSGFRGISVNKFVRAYADYNGVEKELQDQVILQLNKFNSKSVVPIPIKPETDIEVTYKGFDGKEYRLATKAKFIKWKLNKETNELEGWVIAEVGKTEDGGNLAKVLMRDYGTTWFLPNLERSIKTSEVNHEVVKMNNIGIVRPVEFTDSNNITLAIDGNNIYLNYKDTDYIIATWKGSNYIFINQLDSNIKNSKAYSELMNNIKFISRHRRFVAPYGLMEPNHIDC